LLDSQTPRGGPAIDLITLVEPYLGPIVVVLTLAIATAFLALAAQGRRIAHLGRRLDRLTRSQEGRSLEAILDAHLDKVLAVAGELDELAARSAVLEANGRRALQRAGIVRFNPFPDTGGNQSFALALLDANNDGFVVSSLHARAGTRVYAKALTGGRSDATLSDEEAEALRLAMSGPPDRPRRV